MKFCSPWHLVEFFLLLQEDYNHFKVRILQYLMLRHFKFEFTPFAVEKVLGKKNNRSSASFNSLKYAIPNVATDSKIHKSLPLVMYLLHNVTSIVAVYLSIFWEGERFKERVERIQTPAWWNGFNQSHCIQFLTIETWGGGVIYIYSSKNCRSNFRLHRPHKPTCEALSHVIFEHSRTWSPCGGCTIWTSSRDSPET